MNMTDGKPSVVGSQSRMDVSGVLEYMEAMMGKLEKQSRNENMRANQIEPKPGPKAGVKRWARYLKRTTPVERKAK